MNESRSYFHAGDRMLKLIADNYQLIQVMTRFGLRLGFGDKTVAEVCDEAGVDCDTFITVVNFVMEGGTLPEGERELSVEALMQYLKQSHIYFLDYCLPAIRRKLIDGIELRTTDISFLILRFFDDYCAEVRTHMEHEEKTVFVYIADLLRGVLHEGFTVSTYSKHHEEVSSRLRELKSLIIRYCPDSADTNLLNSALYDIYRCEHELGSHCLVEDRLLVPAIMKLEKKVAEEKGGRQ